MLSWMVGGGTLNLKMVSDDERKGSSGCGFEDHGYVIPLRPGFLLKVSTRGFGRDLEVNGALALDDPVLTRLLSSLPVPAPA